jgi:hypothetical protein
MGKPPGDSSASAEETRHQLRTLTKEIESALSEARFRKAVHAFRLLTEAPALYGLERDLLEAATNLKGERLQRLQEALYDLFAKAGKSTPDEVLRNRMRKLFLERLAEKPKSGRPKKKL